MTEAALLAVLIDADNVEARHIEFAVDEARKRGTVTIRYACGRLAAIKGHETVLTNLGFSAEVALPATRQSKDTTDLLIARYAIRLAERRVIDAIMLVSSDSDFAVIAQGVADAGIIVHGFGKATTPSALRNACASFTAFPETEPAATAGESLTRPSGAEFRKMKELIDGSPNADDDGRVRVQTLGAVFKNEFGDDYLQRFEEKNLSSLLRLIDGFELAGTGTDMTIARARTRG